MSAQLPDTRSSSLSNAPSILALLCVVVAIAAGIAGLFSGIGYRLDLWDYRNGIGALRYVFWLAAGTAVVSAVTVLFGAMAGRMGAIVTGLIALLITGTTAYIPWSLRESARRVPPIHDISTDTVNPPQYKRVATLRKTTDHSVAYDGPEVAAQQKSAYPDIAPLIVRAPPDRVFKAARAVLAGMSLEILDADPSNGRLEATETSLLFGFEDDVIVRIVAATDGTTRIDVRSKSRVGRSDLGINAQRVRVFVASLRKKLELD